MKETIEPKIMQREQMCENMEHKSDFWFACEECYKDRGKHLGCSNCKNNNEFCIICVKPVNLQKLKREILNSIFITREELLDIREKKLGDNEKRFKHLEIILNQLKEHTDNADVIISDMFREFELKNPCSREIKDYLTKLWEFMCAESIKRFSSAYEDFRRIEERKVKSIKKYRDKIQEWNKKLEEEELKVDVVRNG